MENAISRLESGPMTPNWCRPRPHNSIPSGSDSAATPAGEKPFAATPSHDSTIYRKIPLTEHFVFFVRVFKIRAWKPENDLPPFSPLSSGFFHTGENAWRESSRFHGKTRKFSASLRLCGRTARGCWDRKGQEKQAVFAQRRRGAVKSLLNPAAKQEFRSTSGGVRKSDLSLRVHRCESVLQCSWVAACRAVPSVRNGSAPSRLEERGGSFSQFSTKRVGYGKFPQQRLHT